MTLNTDLYSHLYRSVFILFRLSHKWLQSLLVGGYYSRELHHFFMLLIIRVVAFRFCCLISEVCEAISAKAAEISDLFTLQDAASKDWSARASRRPSL